MKEKLGSNHFDSKNTAETHLSAIAEPKLWYSTLKRKGVKNATALAISIAFLTACNENFDEVQIIPLNPPTASAASVEETETAPSITPVQPPSATMTPIPTETPVPVENPETTKPESGIIYGVSVMNQTKDKVCNPRSPEDIQKIVSKAQELGATHVGLSTPYDNPSCGDALQYTKEWVSAIRDNGLNVWHRHMPLKFEGIYNEPKNTQIDYIPQITGYINDNPDLFRAGDVFTPIPEPQNSGVAGINCGENCMFESVDDFNHWLVDVVRASRETFENIGLGKEVEVVCCGFDGFVTWGDNNPDWVGKSFLYPDTIAELGHIAIDHYPQGGATMEEDLQEFREVWPNTKLYVSEFGTIPREGGNDTNVEAEANSLVKGLKKHSDIIDGVMYWQAGPAGREALISEENGVFFLRPHFDEIQSFFQESQ